MFIEWHNLQMIEINIGNTNLFNEIIQETDLK